jgi:hypothetical protein
MMRINIFREVRSFRRRSYRLLAVLWVEIINAPNTCIFGFGG